MTRLLRPKVLLVIAVVVAGAALAADTVHIRTTAQISGGDRGTETVDWWIAANAAAPDRIAFSSRTSRKEPIVGVAHYRERAELRLVSLAPPR